MLTYAWKRGKKASDIRTNNIRRRGSVTIGSPCRFHMASSRKIGSGDGAVRGNGGRERGGMI